MLGRWGVTAGWGEAGGGSVGEAGCSCVGEGEAGVGPAVEGAEGRKKGFAKTYGGPE